MLRKIFSLMIICLFIGAGLTQLSAQSNNRAISFWEEVGHWQVDVFCGEEWTDFIVGEGKVHFLEKFKKGERVWQKTNSNMTATGLSGENFKYIEQDWIPISSFVYPVLYEAHFKYQLIGDQGHHYSGVLVVRVIADGVGGFNLELIPVRNKCH